MEVVKTRMQMQGELQARSSNAPRPYRNAFHCFYRIVREEGIGLKGIQRGLPVGMMYQATMNGARLGLFKPLVATMGLNSPNISETHRFFGTLGCASFTGAVGATASSPLFLIKARMQNSGSKAAKHSYSYNGVIDGFRKVYAQEGLRGLFRGVEGAIPRVMAGSASQLTSYETCKRVVQESKIFPADGNWIYFGSSLFSGLVVTTVMNPFDVVSTRLYSQQVGDNMTYKSGWRGPIDCASKLFKAEGFAGFYKGWAAHYLRLGPHTIFTFMFWEHLNRAATSKGF